MDTGTALLAAIITDQDADDPRLAFADWLQERASPGDEDRASFIKAQITVYRLGRLSLCPADGYKLATESAVKEYVQKSPHALREVVNGRNRRCGVPEVLYGVELEVSDGALCVDTAVVQDTVAVVAAVPELIAARATEAKILADRANGWDWNGCPGLYPFSRRGFVEELSSTWEGFEKHADALIWNAKQTVRCDFGCVEFYGVHVIPRRPDKGVAYGADRCTRCAGTGHIPRPCPDTAHPIKKVRLLDEPDLEYKTVGSSDGSHFPVVCGRMLRVPGGSTSKQILEIAFPGIEFDLKPSNTYIPNFEQEPVGLSFARDPQNFPVNRYVQAGPVNPQPMLPDPVLLDVIRRMEQDQLRRMLEDTDEVDAPDNSE